MMYMNGPKMRTRGMTSLTELIKFSVPGKIITLKLVFIFKRIVFL